MSMLNEHMGFRSLIPKKTCNVCGKEKRADRFRGPEIKTCKKCEFRWYFRLLRYLVKERKLTPIERISNRLGYMGTAFIMMSPYLLKYGDIGAVTYVIGGILSIPQVFVAKQWNIVAVNLNVTIGYLLYILL